MNHQRLIVGLLFVAVFGLACQTPQVAYNHLKEPNPRDRGYVLGPSDQIQINVWRNPNLTTSALVRPDGTITMPLIGEIQAENKTPRELKAIIEEKLKTYIKDQAVTVTVAVTQVNSYTFVVAGQIARPGLYSQKYYLTVQEAIALAGGPTRFAKAEQTIIVRKDPQGRIRHIPIDYPSLVIGKKQEQNLVLLPGDIIYVP